MRSFVAPSLTSALLTRPVGQPPNEIRRSYTNFTYKAGNWSKPRRVVAKVERHPAHLANAGYNLIQHFAVYAASLTDKMLSHGVRWFPGRI